jgi:xanthine dehydrogenase YagR molybdenum-binding subunit
MSILSNAMEKLVQTAIGLAPESWLPGGKPDPLSTKHGLIGATVSRLDGPLKVTGKARFAAEVPMEGLLYAALVHSTTARGGIRDLDMAAAEAAPGVVLVMTYKNAPRMKPPALFGTSPTAAGATNLPVMQDAEIRWNGQPVAVVLAETRSRRTRRRVSSRSATRRWPQRFPSSRPKPSRAGRKRS